MSPADDSDTRGGAGKSAPLPHAIGAVLAGQVRALGHQPLLTFYDDASGERTELSYATFDNWASKAANLLVEELDAGRHARLRLAVTGHWTGAVIAAAAWKVGAVVEPLGPGTAPLRADADVLVVAEADAARAPSGHPGLIVVGAGMGGRVAGDVEGIRFGDEVLAFGDDYDDPAVGLDDPALAYGDQLTTHGEALQEAWGALGAGDRLLAVTGLDDRAGLVLGLLAPIAAGASVVWCPGAGDADLGDRMQAEHVTHVLGGDGTISRR